MVTGKELARDAGARPAEGRRRFMRLAAYAAPAAVALNVAWAARALAQSPGPGGLEWPDPEEYGGLFPAQ